MTAFADRATAIGPAIPFVIADLVAEAMATGADVIDLGVGQPDFPVPENVIEATHAALEAGHTTYTPSKGIPALRAAAADYLGRRHGLGYEPEHVIATPGGKHALYIAVQALVEAGDEVVLFDPCWASYEPMVHLAGGTPVHVDLAPHDFRLEPAIPALASAVSDDTALMVLNTPSNPSGMVYTDTALAGIRDLAVEHDIPVIADEIYNEFIFDGTQRSLATFEGMFERTVTVNGVSKSFCMTGYRLGLLAAPADIVTEAGKVHAHSVSCATSLSQHAAVEALANTDVDAHVGEMVAVFERRRDTFVDACAERGVEVPVPEGAFYAMLPVDTDDDMAWCEAAVREAGVGAVPGSAFSSPGYVRVALTQPAERIAEAVERLDRAALL